MAETRGASGRSGASGKGVLGRAFTSLAVVLGVSGARAEPPALGEPAPEFTLPGSDGREHRLSDFRGRQAVVLAWFPKAFTPG
jgi:peroxiredoxin Q/BCP